MGIKEKLSDINESSGTQHNHIYCTCWTTQNLTFLINRQEFLNTFLSIKPTHRHPITHADPSHSKEFNLTNRRGGNPIC